jgi:uncharacterized 2Fe-2S/4Fe-4S cluster protein (DUF4445 family)
MKPSAVPGGRHGRTRRLRFPQLGREIECRSDETVLSSARRAGVRIVGACGGRGTCGSCVVQVIEGRLRAATGSAAASRGPGTRRGYRACQARPLSDCVLEIAARSLAAIARTEVGAADLGELPLAPAVVRLEARVPPATLADPAADAERLARALPGGARLNLDLTAARALPAAARAEDGALSVALRGTEIIACTARRARTLGLAVDLGTTNVAAFLLDLGDGRHLASLGIENPQSGWGADVVSRINHAQRSTANARELREAAVTGINALAADLCRAVGTTPAEIVDVVLCGNTAMQHLLAGLPVAALGRAPFVAAVREAADYRARDLGLEVCPGAYVHLAATVGGFVGGDHVAALLATEPRWGPTRASLLMDIGTNTEISLVHAGRIHSASCPSGPALEGGHISCGMRAADGAIEHVRLAPQGFELGVIGAADAVGVCGSGVLDVLATLFRAGIIDARGRIGRTHPCVRETGGKRSAVLAPGVEFSQDDVRAVQLAKAAIRAGTELLLARAGLVAQDLERILIAGAFGAYIDVASAITIGLLPALPADRVEQVGNAAGAGVRRMLLSQIERERAAALARRCEYVELGAQRPFQQAFLAQIGFPAGPAGSSST